MIAKYEFMTERMGISLENLFRQSDEATAECVLYDDVQQSLRSKGLEEVSRIGLSSISPMWGWSTSRITAMWIIKGTYTVNPIQM